LAEVDKEMVGETSVLRERIRHAGKQEDPSKLKEGIYTRRLSEYLSKDVDWLWDQRVPIGKLSIVSGDPDLGKTWVVLDIIARITTARHFPDSPNPFRECQSYPRRDCLWVSAEDDEDDTVKPRVELLGGDPSRVHSFQFVIAPNYNPRTKKEESKEQELDLSRHIDQIDEWLYGNPLVALVVLDPLPAFLGKIDTHRNSEVRATLKPLRKLAAKHRVAILGINHLNKGDINNAMYRSMGSIAFVAAARASWLVSLDPEDKERRLLTRVKCNLQEEEVGGLAFRLRPPKGLFWEEGRVETTANEALHSTDESKTAPARNDAKEWLTELLKDGPVPAKEVWSKAKADRICPGTLKAAKKELGVRTEKMGGSGDGWQWSLIP
jgi:hypothetical protein